MRLALGPPEMEPEVTLIVVIWFPIIKDFLKRLSSNSFAFKGIIEDLKNSTDNLFFKFTGASSTRA